MKAWRPECLPSTSEDCFRPTLSRPHDLVGRGVLQHAVLMDAAFMRERIPADDRLVVLHRERRCDRYKFRGARQHRGVDLIPVRKLVVANVDRHHDFFQRGIAGAFADAVDGAFDLPRTACQTSQRVGNGHAEIVVAMHGEHGFVRVRHARDEFAHEGGVFVRRGVANRVGNVHRGGAGLDDALDDPAEKFHLAAGAVFRGPFDVVDQIARPRHVGDRAFDDVLPASCSA